MGGDIFQVSDKEFPADSVGDIKRLRFFWDDVFPVLFTGVSGIK
jgi:hypothetical protein